MTNATIKEAKAASTTNATVAGVAATPGGRRLTLTYSGGEKTMVVPPNIPVVLSEESNRSALIPGENVVAYVTHGAGGALSAERVSVGTQRSVPPL